MKYEEFICQVQARLAEKLGDEVRAERRLIVKNNGVALEGITIMEEGKKISPVIYLKDYYVVYQKGVTLEEDVSLTGRNIWKRRWSGWIRRQRRRPA